jgi:IS5 family transposase
MSVFRRKKQSPEELQKFLEQLEKDTEVYLKSPEWAEKCEEARKRRIRDHSEARNIVFTI